MTLVATGDFWGLLVGGVLLFCYGLFGSLRPDVVLRGVAGAHPKSDLDLNDPLLQLITRVVSMSVGVIGLFVIVRVLM